MVRTRNAQEALVALARARVADARFWSVPAGARRHLRERNLAVQEAVGAGMPKEQIASEFGVRVGDVERMLDVAPV